MTTSLRGKPTEDDGFGASASDSLFVIILTIALLLLKFVLGEGGRWQHTGNGTVAFP